MANLPLTEIVIPDSEDVLELAPDLSDEVTALQGAVNTLNTDVSNIPNGTYPNLTAGSILTDKYDIDTTPYLYRALPYRSKRLEDAIVGGSVVWNQLINKSVLRDTTTTGSVTITNNNDGCLLLSGSISNSYVELTKTNCNLDVIAGHKYLFLLPTAPTNCNNLCTLYGTAFGNSSLLGPTIKNCLETKTERIYPRFGANSTGVTFSSAFMYYIGVADLTATFGSTIADYVYTLEQDTAGAGVAWLKARGFFTKPYYEYDTGTLKSVNPTAHITRGVNAWDEEWENGVIYASGSEGADANSIRSKNYSRCLPNTTYYGKAPSNCLLVWYDADKNFISRSNATNTTATLPSNATYFRISCQAYGTTYNNDICINISDPTINGKYFPYEAHTYQLGDVTLRGIPKLVNNELVYDGDIYEHDGAVTRKYGVVDLGTLNWTRTQVGSSYYIFYSDEISDKALNYNFICDKYYNSEKPRDELPTDKSMGVYNSGSSANRIVIRDDSYTDAATFKTAMSGVYLIYELATPTTETTTPFEQYQICETGGTEEYTTTNDVPVGHDTKYFTDVIGNIEDIPAPPTADGTYTLKVTVSSGVPTYAWV